ncbi:hypothetical protein EC973_005247 [Apophysomyces ossiformis]|uniref:Uncharacterized protein n=1 Tax=Apophysomyces ossiformis TaxID=679940 RepID=A0A8H7EU69_9FUNG|nr:hypothetical protein EC973_005247 [Apophysomyces ossiformis]
MIAANAVIVPVGSSTPSLRFLKMRNKTHQTEDTPIEKLKTTLKVLIRNGETVALPKIFRKTGVNDQIQGEKLFKKAIEDIIRQPYDSKAKRWAKMVKSEGYRVLRSEALETFWKELSVQRAADMRLKRFYDDETETLEQMNKRRKTADENEGEGDEVDIVRVTKEDENQQEGREEDNDEAEPQNVAGSVSESATDEEEQTSVAIARTWAEFMEKKDFSGSNFYRLERHGIIQCGVGIKRSDDVPGHLYDQITLDVEKAAFPFKLLSKYIMDILRSKEYGTPNCATLIFARDTVEQKVDDTTFAFVSRILYQFSEYIHNNTYPTQIKSSETAYCHEAVWPLLRCAAHAVSGLMCDFRVGETQLNALKMKNTPNYNADGVVFVQKSKLEVLLLEASGALGTADRHRHVFDHVKAAYGCHAMIVQILEKYPYADTSLIEQVQVLFVHTGGRDDKIRLWVMKPQFMGRIISFERVKSCSIPVERNDTSAFRDVIEFFWLVKQLLVQSVNAVEALRKSNDDNVFNTDFSPKESLASLLEPTPFKPDKSLSCGGIVDLDPVSFTL